MSRLNFITRLVDSICKDDNDLPENNVGLTSIPPIYNQDIEKVILDVDLSGSMDYKDFPPSRLDTEKKACKTFTQAKYESNPDDEIALVSFASVAKVRFDFMPIKQSRSMLEEEINNLRTEGSTNITAGLECSYDLFVSQKRLMGSTKYFNVVNKRIILLTDGHNTDGNKSNLIYVSEIIKKMGVLINCIGIGGHPSDVDEDLLRQIASVVNDEIQYWFITNTESLVRKYHQLATGITR